jgi:hypothetical protein
MSFSKERSEKSSFVEGGATAYLGRMKNRNDSIMTLDEKSLYAIERKARAERSREIARLLAAAWRRVAASLTIAPAGRKATGHA